MIPVPEHGTPEQLADYIREHTRACSSCHTVLVTPVDCLRCVAAWDSIPRWAFTACCQCMKKSLEKHALRLRLRLRGGGHRPFSWTFYFNKREMARSPLYQSREEMRVALTEFLRELRKDLYDVRDETKPQLPRIRSWGKKSKTA